MDDRTSGSWEVQSLLHCVVDASIFERTLEFDRLDSRVGVLERRTHTARGA